VYWQWETFFKDVRAKEFCVYALRFFNIVCMCLGCQRGYLWSGLLSLKSPVRSWILPFLWLGASTSLFPHGTRSWWWSSSRPLTQMICLGSLKQFEGFVQPNGRCSKEEHLWAQEGSKMSHVLGHCPLIWEKWSISVPAFNCNIYSHVCASLDII